jgi:transforming growth factor-beta-induced protein
MKTQSSFTAKKRNSALTLMAACLSGVLLAGCMSTQAGHEAQKSHSRQMTKQNLVQVAQGNQDFSILVEAVVAAGLTDTLANTPNLTVFAPTNQAFANLLGELGVTKEKLLANKPLLTQVLTYHVVPDKVYAAQVKPGMVKTVQGSQFTFGADGSITDGRGRVAKLVATDVKASNGVIHVIDKVILPPTK